MTIGEDPGDEAGGTPVADSIREQILAGYATLLAASRPSDVPALERDRWVDVENLTTNHLVVVGYLDEPVSDQDEDSEIDERIVTVEFELFAAGSSGVPASKSIDKMAQWLQKQLAGRPPVGSPLYSLVYRVRVGVVAAVVLKGNGSRGKLEVRAKTRTLTNDATRWA